MTSTPILLQGVRTNVRTSFPFRSSPSRVSSPCLTGSMNSNDDITSRDTTLSNTSIGRRKPPPKPPRMKSMYEASDNCDLSPTSSVRSLKASLPHSSSALADVTETLDASISHNPERDKSYTNKLNRQVIKEKVLEIFQQAREIFAYEVDPDDILDYLKEKGVISGRTEWELRRTRRHNRSDLLLDLIMSKGHEDFLIFCDSLRFANQKHFSDLLLVLDNLIGLVTQTCASNELQSVNGASTTCDMCMYNNNNINNDEFAYDSASFNIDIIYYDKSVGNVLTTREVAELKRKLEDTGVNDLLKSAKCDTNRYIPAMSVSLYNQCLRSNMDQLINILQNYSCIYELSLAKNHIEMDSIQKLGFALQKNQGLLKLDIRLNVIGNAGASALAEGIKKHKLLRCLNLTSTGLTGSGCTKLLEGLFKNETLIELDVGFNDLKDEGSIALAAVLEANSALKKLRMRDNNVTYWGGCALFKALKRNARLSVLDVSSNRLGNDCIVVLSDTLLSNRTLRELNLENCMISQLGCQMLARALKTNNTIKTLDLSINPIRSDGIRLLSDGLKYNQGIEVLCLNMCSIENDGFLVLLEALKFNSSMTVVKLCYNKIGHPDRVNNLNMTSSSEETTASMNEIYEVLCRVLQLNKNLKVLLWGNKLDDPEAEYDAETCSVDDLDGASLSQDGDLYTADLGIRETDL